jgi:SAM-dependent methyltransferase
MDRAGPQYWDEVWRSSTPQPYPGPIFTGHRVFGRYLRRDPSLRFLEIGCVPGNLMVYFAKHFGYRVDGIDYSSHGPLVEATLELNSVVGRYFQADVFEFTTSDPYDVVFSAGFVEHFNDPVAPVAKHAELTKPGGMVVMTVPNINYFNFWAMRHYQPMALATHRFELMSPDGLEHAARVVGLETVFAGYEPVTFRLITDVGRLDLPVRAIRKALQLTRLDSLPNPWGSPYVIYIGRKSDNHR